MAGNLVLVSCLSILALSYLAVVMIPGSSPDGTEDIVLQKMVQIKDMDDSALLQKEVTIHRSESLYESDHGSGRARKESSEDRADALEAEWASIQNLEGFHEYLAMHALNHPELMDESGNFGEQGGGGQFRNALEENRSQENETVVFDVEKDMKQHPLIFGTQYMKDGDVFGAQARKGAYELVLLTDEYRHLMQDMVDKIVEGFGKNHGRYYTHTMNNLHFELTEMTTDLAFGYLHVVEEGSVGITNMNFTALNRSKSLMAGLTKHTMDVGKHMKEGITELNRQYAPGNAMGYIHEEYGGWRELCPKISAPMAAADDKIKEIAKAYQTNGIPVMDAIVASYDKFPESFRGSMEQQVKFMDRYLGYTMNVILKDMDDLLQGIESIALKFKLCNAPVAEAQGKAHPTRKPLIFDAANADDKSAAGVQLSLGLVTAGFCASAIGM